MRDVEASNLIHVRSGQYIPGKVNEIAVSGIKYGLK